jgi:chemotaxis protein histidine kinase CheA
VAFGASFGDHRQTLCDLLLSGEKSIMVATTAELLIMKEEINEAFVRAVEVSEQRDKIIVEKRARFEQKAKESRERFEEQLRTKAEAAAAFAAAAAAAAAEEAAAAAAKFERLAAESREQKLRIEREEREALERFAREQAIAEAKLAEELQTLDFAEDMPSEPKSREEREGGGMSMGGGSPLVAPEAAVEAPPNAEHSEAAMAGPSEAVEPPEDADAVLASGEAGEGMAFGCSCTQGGGGPPVCSGECSGGWTD